MRHHARILSPNRAKGIVIALFALCVAAWYCVAEKNPAHASVGDTVPQSVQKGVNFLTPDAVNWTKQNSCIACHRQGASLYALSNAKSRGYTVDTDKTTGIGFLAQRINDEQQGDGRWTHFGSFDYAKTSYAFFGLAGYDKYVGTEYSRNLVSAANWAINHQITFGQYSYWIEDHGLFPTTYGNLTVTARMMVGIAQAKQRVDSATAASYQQHLDLAAAWLRANRDGIYSSAELAYTFQVAYGLIGLKAAGAANDDPDVIIYRDRLLAATSQPTGRGWGYTAGHGADEFNTGIALYALGRAGIKPRTNQTVNDAINWLRDQQINVTGTDNGYWRSNSFSSLDIPTTFAILGLSSYGDLGVDLSLDGPDHQVIHSNIAQPQAVTYHLTLLNDGAFDATDTYSLNVQGGLPGWTASVEPGFVTLPSGQSSPVTLTVTAPPNLPEALPVEMTVIATSSTASKISANVKVTTYTDPPPPTTGDPTQTIFVEGANATLNSRVAVQPLAVQVKDAATNAIIRGPKKGVVTFYVAGIAVGTDVDADGDSIFRLNWTPGEAWTANGPQDLRAVYSGIDLPDPQVNLLPSFIASTINIDLPSSRQPTLQLGGPYTVPEGGSIVLTAVGSNLGSGSASYSWDLDNDGTFETQGQNVSFSAARLNGPGSYTVKAQVVSTSGKQASAETVVNVQNVPPVLILPLNQTAVEGSPAYFDLGLLSDPGPDNPWTINVDWGDGTLSSAFNVSSAGPLGKQLHAYADSGLYTVTLRAADKDGATDTKAFKMKVFNVPPTVTAPANQLAEAGIVKSFNLGLFTDPGPDGLWTADIDWGDFSAHTSFNLFTPGALTAHTHTYAYNGNYTVTIRVTDKDGGVGSATFKVTSEHIAVVRHALKLTSGRIEGTIRQLLGESDSLGGTSFITSDLKLPGVPSVTVNGSPTYNGTIEGTGSTAPSDYQVKINGNATLGGHLITRTDPVDLLPLAAPPAPTGTRDVILKQAGQNFGDSSTLRDLTLTGNAGQVAVPPGTYRQFTADSHSTLLLGVANSAQPSVYNFQELRLNGGSALRLAGPVKINVAKHVILDGNSVMGLDTSSRSLKLYVAGDNGGDTDDKVTVRGGSLLYAIVLTPLGRVTVGGNNSLLRGGVACDYLSVGGSSVLHLLSADDATKTTNKAPVVNAGPDRTIALPSTAVSLSGAVTDDGLPLPATLSASWSEVSGPGPVIFSNANAASTQATFSEPGTYVLRLAADDSLFVGSDDVSINVTLDNQPPIVNAGLDREIFLPVNSTTLGGIVFDDGLPANGVLTKTWSKMSGPGSVTLSSPHELTTDATFSAPGTYVLRLTASDSQLTSDSEVTVKVSAINQAPVVNAGPDQIVNATEQVNLNGAVSDDGLPAGSTLSISWAKMSGPGTVTFNNAGAAATRATFSEPGSYLLRLSASDSQFTTVSDVLITVKPPNQPPTVSAGMSQTITLPASASLSGMVSDDGLPTGNTLTISWSKLSGTGDVTFGNSSQAVTTASFTLPGAYVLRLTANDSLLESSADVTITVNPAIKTNEAPTVNAGPDQAITLPAQANLNGTASDDGLPANSTLTTTWTKLSGPGIVTFANPNVAVTSASFSAAGTYLLRLTATDSQLTSTDDIIITVKDAPPVNKSPTVNAGPAQTVTLPHTANLVGAVADDGLPAGGSITVQWSEVSGPGTVIFSAPDRVTTPASFSEPGSYVLRLTASDSELSASGDISITVNGPNKPPTVNAGPGQTVKGSTPASLHGDVSDDGLPTGATLQATWSEVSGPGGVTFSNPHQALTSATFSAEGTYVLRLTASDSELTSSDDVTVTVEAAPPAPVVSINSPADGSRITTLTNFVGSVSNGLWRLEYSLNSDDGSPAQVWTPFASGSGPIVNAPLGTFDPTMLLNGSYTVRLIATDDAGQTRTSSVSALVRENQKVGNFTISFTDLSTPVAGLPIEVIRTYDSRDKRVGDFGVGWTLGLKNVRVEKTDVLGQDWEQVSSGGILQSYCVQPTKPHVVSITFPDGKVYEFQATTSPQCQPLTPIETATVGFTPMPGTFGSLSIEGDNDVLVVGSVPGSVDLVSFDNADTFNSRVFRLKTRDGMVYVIDQQGGVRSMTDPNGNTLTINSGGIIHSSGKSISFTRDALGRITHIADPSGHTMDYNYDANGDLVSYRDRENNVTSFTYDSTHGLLTINDPRGVQPIRNDYDADGRLISHTDAFGNVIKYTHNLAARQETITDRLGHLTLLEYDANGNVVREVDAAGAVKAYTYDASDNVLSETNALGQTTTYTYDSQNNRTSATDSLGNTTSYSYNAKGEPLTITDALGHVTTNTYDDAGNILTTKDPLGNTTSITYSSQNGQPETITDALGGVTHNEYDAEGHLGKQTNALGAVISFTYDANGNRTSQTTTRTLSNGTTETLMTNYQYDHLDRLVKTTLPDGSTTSTVYDENDRPTAVIDQLGRQIAYRYDEMGRLIETLYPDGVKESATYDAEGRRLTGTDRAGRVTSYAYDPVGRLIRTTYPDGTSTSTTYNAQGQALANTDALGHVTRQEYDAAGRLTKMTDALGHVMTFTSDALGNQISQTDAQGHVTRSEYDARNRRTKVIYADQSSTTTSYDALNHIVAKTDQAGATVQSSYDATGHLLKVTDALGQVTKYGYDEMGLLISQTDARNHTTRFEYDKLGRRIKRILPGGAVETYSYDAAGNLQSRRDFNGKTTTYSYDVLNRLLSKTPDASFNQSPVTFIYTLTGQRARMMDVTGTTNYTYDSLDHLTSKSTPEGTLTYTYGASGNLLTTRSSNANGMSVDYDYDALNRLRTVTDNRLAAGANVTTYSYDSTGNLQSYTYPNGVRTAYAYNNLNRLTAMSIGNGSSTLESYSYTLGAVGNRLSATEQSGRTVQYTYDALYRLTGETITGDPHSANGAVSYAYDSVGNRLTRTATLATLLNQNFTYDADDRPSNNSFDANGNTIAANGNVYHFDWEDHLTSINNGIVTYLYDGDGNRIGTQVGQTVTRYLVDTNNPTGFPQTADELTGGVVTRSYTYGHSLISQNQFINGSWQVSFYGYDGHGDVRLLTDTAGAKTDTYTYDAFGNLLARTGTTPNEHLYAGEQLDSNTGLYYLRARYLDPVSGRFWTMDSYEGQSSDPRSLHKYLYAFGNPVNRLDPSGHESGSISEKLCAFSIVAGLQLMRALSMPVVRRGLILVTAYAFLRDPEEFTFWFLGTGGNPADLAELLVTDIGKLGKSLSAATSDIQEGVATLNYNGGSLEDFWYKAGYLQSEAESNGLIVVEGTDAIRNSTAQANFRKAAIKDLAEYFHTEAGLPMSEATARAKDFYARADVDHLIDLQVSGGMLDPNATSNLGMVSSSINRSIGSQLHNQIRMLNLRGGDKIVRIVINAPPLP